MGKDIRKPDEVINHFSEIFFRAVERVIKDDEIDDRLENAQGVVSNIMAYAKSAVTKSDPVDVVMVQKAAFIVLNRAMDFLEQSSLDVSAQYLQDNRKIAAEYSAKHVA